MFKNTMIFHVFLTTKKTVFKNTMIFHAFLNYVFLLFPKNLTFFRHVDLPKQSGPPRRSFPARHGASRGVQGRSGASRGDPELNVGALPKPIYTRARIKDWR